MLADAVLVGWAALSLLPSFLGFLGLPSGLMWEEMKFLRAVFKQDRTWAATAAESWDVYCARQELIAIAMFNTTSCLARCWALILLIWFMILFLVRDFPSLLVLVASFAPLKMEAVMPLVGFGTVAVLGFALLKLGVNMSSVT